VKLSGRALAWFCEALGSISKRILESNSKPYEEKDIPIKPGANAAHL
jgi:hypothetical protein